MPGIVTDAENGVQAAKKILEALPRLSPYEALMWQSYGELIYDAPVGMGSGGFIPITSIYAFAEFEGFGYYDTRDLIRVVRALERVKRDHHDKQNP